MAIRFDADEVFELAEKIEINGANFYRAAAKALKNPSASETLLKLASMEDEHRIIFAALRGKLKEREKGDALNDPDGETKKYLGAIANGRVFDLNAEPSDLISGKPTINEIIRTAIGFEKDSIIFYLGMREVVPENLGRDKVDNIIEEEKSHIVILTDEYKELKRQEGGKNG